MSTRRRRSSRARNKARSSFEGSRKIASAWSKKSSSRPAPGTVRSRASTDSREPGLRGGRSGAAEHPGQPPQRPRIRAQRPHQPAPGVRSRQPGQDARRHQRGLPGARGAHDEQEVLLPDPAADVVALLVTPEEQAGILGTECEQPGVRAGQRFRRRRATLEQLPQAGHLGLPSRPLRTVQPYPEVQMERKLVRLQEHRDQPTGIPP